MILVSRKLMVDDFPDGTVSGTAAVRRAEAQKKLDLMNLKFKGQTIAEKTAKSWGKIKDNGGLGKFMGSQRPRYRLHVVSLNTFSSTWAHNAEGKLL